MQYDYLLFRMSQVLFRIEHFFTYTLRSPSPPIGKQQLCQWNVSEVATKILFLFQTMVKRFDEFTKMYVISNDLHFKV